VTPYLLPISDRLMVLTGTLRHLKDRIRDAVATELGKVVADAVRDWITAALRVRSTISFDDREPALEGSDGWGESDAAWGSGNRAAEDPEPDPEPPPSRWAAALSVGAVATRWLIARRLPPLPSLGVGALLVAVGLAGGPLARAALAAAATAADLVRLTRADAPPDF